MVTQDPRGSPADNRAWVRAILGDQVGDHDQAVTHGEPGSRYVFELARPDDPDVPPYQMRILRAISARMRWRDEMAAARARRDAAARSSPQLSATELPRAA